MKPSPPKMAPPKVCCKATVGWMLGRAAQPAVAVDDVLGPGSDLDREDPSGKLRGEHQHPWAAGGLVAGEEDARPAGDPLQARHEPAAAPGVRRLAELHVRRTSRRGRHGSTRRLRQARGSSRAPGEWIPSLRPSFETPPCRPVAMPESSGCRPQSALLQAGVEKCRRASRAAPCFWRGIPAFRMAAQ